MTGVSASAELENHCSGSHPELVTCQGLGLKYAERDRLNCFNVDASQAGRTLYQSNLFIIDPLCFSLLFLTQ